MTTAQAQAPNISNKIQSKDKSPLVDNDTDNLDLVRNILFGEQVKKTEERRLELENLLEESINSLRNETEQKFAGVSEELSALISLLTDETKARQGEFGHTRNALNNLTQQLSQLDVKTQKAQSQLQEKLVSDTNQMRQHIGRVNEEISLKLEQAINQLRHEKADRKAIAGLLSGVAKQLLDNNENA